MKRELTKDEEKKTKTGIAKLSLDIAELLEAMDFATRKLKFLEKSWEFEDYERPIARKNTIYNSEKKVKECDGFIKEKQNIIKEMEEQLKHGVNSITG